MDLTIKYDPLSKTLSLFSYAYPSGELLGLVCHPDIGEKRAEYVAAVMMLLFDRSFKMLEEYGNEFPRDVFLRLVNIKPNEILFVDDMFRMVSAPPTWELLIQCHKDEG